MLTDPHIGEMLLWNENYFSRAPELEQLTNSEAAQINPIAKTVHEELTTSGLPLEITG